jgi:serine/threonine protein kinase
MMDDKTQDDITIKISKESNQQTENLINQDLFFNIKNLKKIEKYEIINEIESVGGQADLFLVKDINNKKFVLKLYKKNVEINDLAIKKIIELSKRYPEYFINIYELNYDPNLKRYYEIQEYIDYGNLEDFNKNILSKDLNYELVDKIYI